MNIERGEPADPVQAFKPGPLFGSRLGPVAKVVENFRPIPNDSGGSKYGVFSHNGLLLGTFDDYVSALLACGDWAQAKSVHYLGTVELRR